MAAENNLIKKADLARAREIEFTYNFSEGVRKLMEALGVTRKIAKQAGTVLKAYKATGTLENGAVAEGDTITASVVSKAGEDPAGKLGVMAYWTVNIIAGLTKI